MTHESRPKRNRRERPRGAGRSESSGGGTDPGGPSTPATLWRRAKVGILVDKYPRSPSLPASQIGATRAGQPGPARLNSCCLPAGAWELSHERDAVADGRPDGVFYIVPLLMSTLCRLLLRYRPARAPREGTNVYLLDRQLTAHTLNY
uniref:Uncharacterized protein n=1 Tax=Plectus sambesii TaxID=2011161 RepID=A0A914VXE5_9BILA